MEKITRLMQISVIIPVFNKIEIIERCIMLNIIHADALCEWIIIDNASDIPTREGLQRLKELVEKKGHIFSIVYESTNTGVAVAWNRGLSLAHGEYICILNNDCVMMPRWDHALLHQTVKADLISPLIIENGQLETAYSLDDFLTGACDWNYFLHKNQTKFLPGYFSGIVLFAKRSVYDRIGPFDENFWLSMEDIDYEYRAQKLGYKIGITGTCIGFHYSSLTRKGVLHNELKNQQYFADKWGWNYSSYQAKVYNKLCRSLYKLAMKKFHIMFTVPQKFPS